MARVDVSFHELDIDDAAHAAACLCLSADEHERAARYHRLLDRRRFEARHGRLRAGLARVLDCEAARITFAATQHGKPYVSSPDGAPAFSVSHSGALMALAISHDGCPGVDIEAIAPMDNDIAPVAFTAREQCWLTREPEGCERDSETLRLWTCKEAVLKATGTGLLVSPTLVEITFPVHEMQGAECWGQVVWSDEIAARDRRVAQVVSFTPRPGFLGAVAIAVPPDDVPLRRFRVATGA